MKNNIKLQIKKAKKAKAAMEAALKPLFKEHEVLERKQDTLLSKDKLTPKQQDALDAIEERIEELEDALAPFNGDDELHYYF